MTAAQRLRPDVVAKREAFLAEVAQIPAERLVFVDESGIEIGSRSAYGLAPIASGASRLPRSGASWAT